MPVRTRSAHYIIILYAHVCLAIRKFEGRYRWITAIILFRRKYLPVSLDFDATVIMLCVQYVRFAAFEKTVLQTFKSKDNQLNTQYSRIVYRLNIIIIVYSSPGGRFWVPTFGAFLLFRPEIMCAEKYDEKTPSKTDEWYVYAMCTIFNAMLYIL